MDTNFAVSEDNPLRQVIINTHSPSVVMSVPDSSLLVAESTEFMRDGSKGVSFSPLDDTWRATVGIRTVARGKLLAYLNPRPVAEDWGSAIQDKPVRRVVDREDLQQLLLPLGKPE